MRTPCAGATAPRARSTIGSLVTASGCLLAGGSLLAAATRADDARRALGRAEAEVARELAAKLVLDLLHRHRPVPLTRQRRDLLVADPAWHHLVEPAQVGGDVESEAVGCHPTPDANADCGQLAL